jgi:hypothetical protein
MGTTESIFYDDPLDDPTPTARRPAPPQAHAHARHAADPSRAALPRTAPVRPTRNKPPPVASTAVTKLQLSGLVLGMAQSGKQTLLQRLEGKDPFTDSSLDDCSETARSEIVAPYLAPPDHQVWDRIQLRVGVSRSVPSETQAQTQAQTQTKVGVDFAVVLINPRHDPVRLRAYLDETIRALLHLQGHQAVDEEEEVEESAGQEQVKGSSGKTLRPVCLCLLLNFRDLESSSDDWLQESDVQALTMEVLQDYFTLEPSRLVLQCGSTSLFNCYGLNVLHHFIYQCYLQRKRSDLEQFLIEVGQAQIASRKVPSVSYDEFLGIAAPSSSEISIVPPTTTTATKKVKKAKKERRRDAASKKSSQTKEVIRDVGGEGDQQQGTQEEAVEVDSHSDTPTGRRRIMTSRGETRDSKVDGQSQSKGSSSGQERPSFVSTKEALEAFLASDDEEDVNGSPSKALNHNDEVENEDDDYFYDESGSRRKMKLTAEGAPGKLSAKGPNNKADTGRDISPDDNDRGGKSGNKSPVQTTDNDSAEARPKDDDAKGSRDEILEASSRSTSPVTPSEIKNDSDAEDESETGSKDCGSAKDARDGGRVEAEGKVGTPASSDTQEELSLDIAKPHESSTEAIGDASEHAESAGSDRCISSAAEDKKSDNENGDPMSTVKDENMLSEDSGDNVASTAMPTPALDSKGDSPSHDDAVDTQEFLEDDECEGSVTKNSPLPASSDVNDESDSDDDFVIEEISPDDNSEHVDPEELVIKEASVTVEGDESEGSVTKNSPLPPSSDANDERDSGDDDCVVEETRAIDNDEHDVDPEELAVTETSVTVEGDESEGSVTKISPIPTSSDANDESDSDDDDFFIEEIIADDHVEHVDPEEVVVKDSPVTAVSETKDDSDSDDRDFAIHEIPSSTETNGLDEDPSSQIDNARVRDEGQTRERETITPPTSGDGDDAPGDGRYDEKPPPSQQRKISKESTNITSSLIIDDKDEGEGEGEVSIGNSVAKDASAAIRSRPSQTKESISVATASSGISAAARAAIAAAQVDFERMVQEPSHADVPAKKAKKKKKESKDGEKKKKKDKKTKRSKAESSP